MGMQGGPLLFYGPLHSRAFTCIPLPLPLLFVREGKGRARCMQRVYLVGDGIPSPLHG